MTQLKETIRADIFSLLGLVVDGRIEDSEGCTTTKESVISKKKGYSLKLHTLVDKIFDERPEIRENCSHKFMKKQISDFVRLGQSLPFYHI